MDLLSSGKRGLAYVLTLLLGSLATIILARYGAAGWFSYDQSTNLVSVQFSVEALGTWVASTVFSVIGGGVSLTAWLKGMKRGD